MDAGFRTPFLDFFRRGDVAPDIRLLAAQGGLAPRAHEQLGLLALLVDDADPEIRYAAEQTLSLIPSASLSAFLARSDVGTELRGFFAARGIEPADVAMTETDRPLLEAGGADGDAGTPVAETGAEEGQASALNKIAGLNVAQRVALAMKGSREERAILIRDSNKLVAVSVLSSPKITGTEIESMARMANVSEEILRIIGNTRAWVKSYPVVQALTKNPKTPVALSMNLLSRLTDKDLRTLSTDRNIPDVLRLTARRKVVLEK